MDTLDIPPGTYLKVLKVTPHKEMHGKDPIQAVSLRLEWVPTDNGALNQIAEGLQDALLYSPELDGQEPLDGVPEVKKLRRCPALGMPVKVPAREFTGYTMCLEAGINDDSDIELYSVKKSKFEATVSEGGVAAIRWSANSSRAITPELVGKLCALEGESVKLLELTPPDESEPIDGTGAQFNAEHPLLDAADAFADNEANGLNKDASEVPTAPQRRSNRPSLAVQDHDDEDDES